MASARSIKNLFPLIGALLLCIAAVTAFKTRFIDEDGEESLAQTFCARTQDSYTQIAKVSTIKRLVAYLENLPFGHKLEACRNSHREALEELDNIVSVRNDNVWSDEKISLIEEFHHTYISKSKNDKEQQKLDNTLEAPELLKNFFYHYAMKVATICKDNLIEKMNEVAPVERDLKVESDVEKVDTFLQDFASQIGSTSGSFKNYGDISLLWNCIDQLPIREGNSFVSREGKRMAFATSNAKPIKAFQKECLIRLKPVYGALALPVIRLIDLGYYLDGEPFESKLAARKDVGRLIGIAQLCESILPIRIIANENLPPGELHLVTIEQANKIPLDVDENEDGGKPAEPVVIPDDHHNSLVNLTILDSATPDGAHRFVKSVRRNIRVREITWRSIVGMMAIKLADKAKSMVGKIFYKPKDQRAKKVKRAANKIQKAGGDEYDDLIEKPKSFMTNVLDELRVDWATTKDVAKTGGPAVFFVMLFILIKWVYKIVKYTLLGALYAIVYPFILYKNSKKTNQKLIKQSDRPNV